MINSIEEDDEKMDEMLILQSLTETEIAYDSIEEKYEEQILMDEISEMIGRQLTKLNEEVIDESL
jgi:hypothetical protein